MTIETTDRTKLVKPAAGTGARHSYQTADGRFLIHRGAGRDNWSVEDTQRWMWRWDTRGGGIVVEHDEYTCWTLADAREQITKDYALGDELLPRRFRTEAEARADGEQYRSEQRRAAIERERAAAEAARQPTPGAKTIRRNGGEYDICDADGHQIARAETVGDATLFAGAADLATAAQAFLDAALAANCLPADALELVLPLMRAIEKAQVR